MFDQDVVTVFKENFDKKTGSAQWEAIHLYGVEFQEIEARTVSDKGLNSASVYEIFISEEAKGDIEISQGDMMAKGIHDFGGLLDLKQKLKFMEKIGARTVATVSNFDNVGFNMNHLEVTCK